jgi:hypothetical protein
MKLAAVAETSRRVGDATGRREKIGLLAGPGSKPSETACFRIP